MDKNSKNFATKVYADSGPICSDFKEFVATQKELKDINKKSKERGFELVGLGSIFSIDAVNLNEEENEEERKSKIKKILEQSEDAQDVD